MLDDRHRPLVQTGWCSAGEIVADELAPKPDFANLVESPLAVRAKIVERFATSDKPSWSSTGV